MIDDLLDKISAWTHFVATAMVLFALCCCIILFGVTLFHVLAGMNECFKADGQCMFLVVFLMFCACISEFFSFLTK